MKVFYVMENRVFKENRCIDNQSSIKKVSIAPGLLEFFVQANQQPAKEKTKGNAHQNITKQLLSDQGFCLRRSVPPGEWGSPHRSQEPPAIQGAMF